MSKCSMQISLDNAAFTADAVPDPERKSTNTAVTPVKEISPSLAESVEAAQNKVQEGTPAVHAVGGVAAARQLLMSALMMQPAYAGKEVVTSQSSSSPTSDETSGGSSLQPQLTCSSICTQLLLS